MTGAWLLRCWLGAALALPFQASAVEDGPPSLYTDYMLSFDVPFRRLSWAAHANAGSQLAARMVRFQAGLPSDRQTLCAIVIGHSEIDEGADREQLRLSGKRAAVVADLVVHHGVARQNVHVRHVGAAQPIDAQPSRRNSRVEVELFPCV